MNYFRQRARASRTPPASSARPAETEPGLISGTTVIPAIASVAVTARTTPTASSAYPKVLIHSSLFTTITTIDRLRTRTEQLARSSSHEPAPRLQHCVADTADTRRPSRPAFLESTR